MNANAGSGLNSYFLLNGRKVFVNGLLKRWRCPVCAWWRDWGEERCCGCGLLRDDPAAAAPPRELARAAASRLPSAAEGGFQPGAG
jgi:hypothetical protein